MASGANHEREADKVADDLLAGRTIESGPGLTPVSPQASALSHRPTATGHPLDGATRAYFEPRLGQDLADVRVHTGAEAVERADALSARAYTVENDIVFNTGEYAPHTGAGRHLVAHELAHVAQQARGGPAVQRQPLPPGECDSQNLGSLGPKFHLDETAVSAQGFASRYVAEAPATADDFVLYCPQRSTRPLKRLVPCTTAYFIGDAEASGKGRGKDEVWARQEGESGYYWGYVKKTYLSATGCGTQETQDTSEDGNPWWEEWDSEGADSSTPSDTGSDEAEVPMPENNEAGESEAPTLEAGTLMRVNAPNDPGWAPVVPNYLVVSAGEPHFFPHFLQVEIVEPMAAYPGSYLVEAQEGKYDGRDAYIHGSYLMKDPGSPGYAETLFNMDTNELYYGGKGPVEAVTMASRVPPPGIHELRVPDYPHDKGGIYGAYATTWFLVGDSGDKYFHPGLTTLGCVTVRGTASWPDIWTYLIDARLRGGVVGTIEIVRSPPPLPAPTGAVDDQDDPLGGRTSGGPGNRVWHPPGTGQGGVPID